LIRGDSHLNDANYPLPGDAIRAMTGKPDPHSSLPDLRRKSRISRPDSLVLKFGVATLKSAQQGRGSVRSIVPKKASHSRASDSRFHASTHAEIHAAAVEEAR
jgi:hypothetical protein